jgi:hypothetical protein
VVIDVERRRRRVDEKRVRKIPGPQPGDEAPGVFALEFDGVF